MRMLAAPSTSLGAIENTIVVGVHLIKPGARPLCRPLLGALDVLVARYGAGTWWSGGRGGQRRGAIDGGSLQAGLPEGHTRQQ